MHVISKIILITSLIYSTIVSADNILCPSEALIRDSGYRLDRAGQISPTPYYSVWSSTPVATIDKLVWYIETSAITAGDAGAAMSRAKEAIQKVNIESKYAEETAKGYKCRYASSNIGFFVTSNK